MTTELISSSYTSLTAKLSLTELSINVAWISTTSPVVPVIEIRVLNSEDLRIIRVPSHIRVCRVAEQLIAADQL